MQVFVLSDNTAGAPSFLAEHGLSLLVRNDWGDLLMDVGQGMAMMHNAELLRINLDNLKGVVLSHGHYDHTAGLPQLLKRKSPLKVYAHPGIFEAKFFQVGEAKRFIGLPFRREFLESMGAEFDLGDSSREILPGAFLSGEIPRQTDFEPGDPNLKVMRGDELQVDPFHDDQALFLPHPEGTVVILGCAHAGTINTLLHAMKVMGDERIKAVIGGSHLLFLRPEQLERTIEELKAIKPGLMAFSHCTGQLAARRLSQEFGERFIFNQTGAVINI